jgi:gas vesicle protein
MDKKDCQCKQSHGHHGGGFQNGLVVGLVVGAAAVFFLGTTKGKQILKALAENGFEDLTDLLNEEDIPESYEEEYGAEEPGAEVSSSQSAESVPSVARHVTPRPLKRFFRGIKK